MDLNIIKLKKKMLDVAYKAQQAHLASAFSITQILWTLYDKVMNLEQDKFILSKGHGCLALYAILNEKGYISDEELFSFCRYDSILGGHPKLSVDKGIHASTGSLGHGLPIAVGMAMAAKIKNEDKHIYCLIGDGEFSEGTLFESLQLGIKYKLNNLTCIVDWDDTNSDYLKNPYAFFHSSYCGWYIENTFGNMGSIEKILKLKTDQPKLIFAKTIKGEGCKTMEESPSIWHHKAPSNIDELNTLFSELDGKKI